MATTPAPALMDTAAANRFLRRGQRETIVAGSATTSRQWAAILDSCEALGLPVPVCDE